MSCAQSRDLVFIIATGRLNWPATRPVGELDRRSIFTWLLNKCGICELVCDNEADRNRLSSSPHKRALQKKKEESVHRQEARASAKVNRRSQRGDLPEDLTRPAVKLQLLARQWALPRISNQLLPRKLKLNVLSTHSASPLPSATTTIVITTNVVVVVVDTERAPAHGLRLRRALCE